jgi:DICT domain-containing protein
VLSLSGDYDVTKYEENNVQFIEQHYEHINYTKMTDDALREAIFDEYGHRVDEEGTTPFFYGVWTIPRAKITQSTDLVTSRDLHQSPDLATPSNGSLDREDTTTHHLSVPWRDASDDWNGF